MNIATRPPTAALDAEFPAHLQCLFRPKRRKVLWGGRGAGRSWGCARALLLLGTKKAIRVLCCRELQNSISESVHQVLRDQIEALGLSNFYEIQVAKIIGKNGTTFSFEGIKNNTSKIRSYEGIDYCWVEEANKVSKSSWTVLIPTIRKQGSEIWVTFNPELETDYTYKRFVMDPALEDCSELIDGRDVKWRESNRGAFEGSIVVKMTFRENPWFDSTTLRAEMEEERKNDFDSYLNIWEGNTVSVLEGAVYAKQLRRVLAEGRICKVPYDPSVAVDTFWDIGRADCTAIWFAQQVAMQVRVLAYFEDHLQDDVSYYLKELQSRGYFYGTIWLPHDAKAKRLGTKKTIEEQIRASGYTTRITPKLSLTDGINAARLIFNRCWFDEAGCEDGLYALKHYRYRVIDGQLSNEPLHNDGADAFRYLAIGVKTPNSRPTVAARLAKATKAFRAELASDNVPNGQGWMR